jgi:D-beta-D-heptose 7-phosphate kinase/D-beta-D-heptose 1-phosphate adenosyltransferase
MIKVWVNGVFDVLHIGHIKLFEFAKSQGDYLTVGIDSDKRVKFLKGNSRPINNQITRSEILKAIKYIDDVVIFNYDEELISLIKNYNPDIFVIGREYENKRIIGGEYAHKIIYFDKVSDYSSTKLINKLKNDNMQ